MYKLLLLILGRQMDYLTTSPFYLLTKFAHPQITIISIRKTYILLD